MDLVETMVEMSRLELAPSVSRDLRLEVRPASKITPELRAALKEHSKSVVCQLMWSELVGMLGEEVELPPTSPDLRRSFGDPQAYAEALLKYALAARYWRMIELSAGRPAEAIILTPQGTIVVGPEGEEEENA
jgi:hypothetical protein